MRKITPISVLLTAAAMLLASGCKDNEQEDLRNAEAAIKSVVFENNPLVTAQPALVAGSNDITFRVAASATADDLKVMTPTISVSTGAKVDPASGTPQDFSNGPVTYTVTSENGLTRTQYKLICAREPHTGATITSIGFDYPFVYEQPVLPEMGTDLGFTVLPEATQQQLAALSPKITVSAGATVSPTTPQDFTDGPVAYTVTSEDGKSSTVYNVACTALKGKTYDFETWSREGGKEEMKYAVTPDWASPNVAIVMLKQFASYKGGWPMDSTRLSHSGTFAAQMVTQDTKGGKVFGQTVPKVTAGTIFLGTFKTEISSQLKSTKFGIVFADEPVLVRGFYQYKAGETFYNNMDVDPEGRDGFAMSAVLYEVADETETLDGTNIYESEKIVATASLSGMENTSAYTPFELKLTYIKPYNPEVKHKFTVIFSASKDGVEFKGAPGSTLTVDDVEIVSR